MSVHPYPFRPTGRAHPSAIAMPPLNPQRVAHDAFASTDHGALVDGTGDVSHVQALRLIRSDGTDTLVPANLRQASALELLAPGQLHPQHQPLPSWFSEPPARRSSAAFGAAMPQLGTPTGGTADAHPRPTVRAPALPGAKREQMRQQSSHFDDPRAVHHYAAPEQRERIPTWLLGLAALLAVATTVASTLLPWGWAAPFGG